MTWLQSILIAFLSGVIGLLCGGFVMAGWANWHRVSNFEGKAGFAIIGVALLSGIAAFIIGLVTARVLAAGASPVFSSALGTAAGIIVGISAIAAGLGWLTGDRSLRSDDMVTEPTYAETEAAKVADEQAAFDGIPDDAPIEAWLESTKYGATEERQAAVVRRVTAKIGWEQELAGLMLADDARLSDASLRFVYDLPQPPAELIPAVEAAGRDLAEQMRKVNATTVEQDPGFLGAADVSIRFSGWMAAARMLREKCAGDFVPELLEILALSRIREDSQVMRGDIRRVASHYAKEWAGVEPLPGDPPPK